MNDLLHFAFSQQSSDALEFTAVALSVCDCCHADEVISNMHEVDNVATADRATLVKVLCRVVFRFILAVYSSNQLADLVKLQKRGCGKKRDVGYDSWVHFSLENEVPMMQSAISWYATTGEMVVLEFIHSVEAMATMGRSLGRPQSYFHNCASQVSRLFDVTLANVMNALESAVRNRQPLDDRSIPSGSFGDCISSIFRVPSIPDAQIIAAEDATHSALCAVQKADFNFAGGAKVARAFRKGSHESASDIAHVLD